MSKSIPHGAVLAAATVLAIAVGLVIGNSSSVEQRAFARETGRKAVLPVQKGAYFPNTETLVPDEMRAVSLGTGLPTPLTKAQKSASFMVELGNGDIFLFDVGTGSVENLFAIQPRFAKVDKVFLSHLHTDHFGDLDALWVGGWGSAAVTRRCTFTALQGPSPSLARRPLLKDLRRHTRGTSLAGPALGRTPVAS
jgi:ribonuclease Z